MKKEYSISKRNVMLLIFITLCMAFLTVRLFIIQILQGQHYAYKAVQQRAVAIPMENMRGDIIDRNGIPFTRGTEKSYLVIFPGFTPQNIKALSIIEQITGVSTNKIQMLLNQNEPIQKLEIKNSIPEKELDIGAGKYPGLMILRQYDRYDDHSLARHLIGYIQKDGQPMMGMEKQFDKYLNPGNSNMVYALIDAKKHLIPGVGNKIINPDKKYYNVQLSLDYYIQQSLEEALDGHGGRNGGLIIDIKSGDILALASRPQFLQYRVDDSNNKQDCFWSIPLKAFSPGSVFKIIVAAAALEGKNYTENSRFFCNGGKTINGVHYSCHPSTNGLGDITLRQAFAYSCNDTFIDIATNIGGYNIENLAKKFGLGCSLNIGIQNDEGNLPQKDEYAGAGIGNLAIGQGKVMATPLQIADILCTIADEGYRKPLKLIKAIISPTGNIKEWNYEKKIEKIISTNTAFQLQNWMRDVTEYGTGKLAQSSQVLDTAGKTGTAQVSGDPYTKHYGWFAGFFPVNDPRYAIVILCREEGEGGKTAAPIFKEVAESIWKYENELYNLK